MAEEQPGRIMRPCDIPIYGFKEEKKSCAKVEAADPGLLKSSITTVRQTLQEAFAPMKQVEEQAKHIFETGKAHSQGFYVQLQEDQTLQAGFIAGGGLVGLMFGALRGRMLKKLFYTGLGAGGAAAVCFPREARALGDMAVKEGEEYGKIAYNFATGVGVEAAAPVTAKETPKEAAPKKETPPKAPEAQKKPEVDHGMSKKEDKDMYSTRGN